MSLEDIELLVDERLERKGETAERGEQWFFEGGLLEVEVEEVVGVDADAGAFECGERIVLADRWRELGVEGPDYWRREC